MTKSNFKIFSYLLMTVLLTLGLSISFQSLLAAWTAPLANPPTCLTGNPGCDEPVNKGPNLQIRGGPLYVNADNLAATGLVAYGNVGIGTTNPSSALHINGSGKALKIIGSGPTSGVSQLIVQADTTGGAPYSYNQVLVQNLDTTTQGAASRFVVMGPYYGTDIVQYNNATPDTGSMRAGVGLVRSSGSGLSIAATNPVGDLRFYTGGGDAANERMRINVNGNVGIGTTNPSQKLSVAGTIESTSGGFKFPDGTTQATAAGGGASQWITSGSNIYYNTGNVGIGTTGPGARLDLGQLPASTEGLRIKIGVATPFSPFIIVKANGTDAFRVKEDGNVGIGTTNPTNKLEVSGSGAALKVVGSGPTSGVSQLIVQADTTGGAPYSYNQVLVQNLDTTTQGAASRFVVMGPSYGTDLVQYNNATPDTGSMRAGVGAVRSSGSGLSLVASNPVSDMRFYTAGTTAANERMRITGAGNVGIGTAAPSEKLEVAGNIKATALCIGSDCKTAWNQVGGTTISATNVSAGAFGANTGGGNYSFPGSVGIGTAAPTTILDVRTNSPTYNPIRIWNTDNTTPGAHSKIEMTHASGFAALGLAIFNNATTGTGFFRAGSSNLWTSAGALNLGSAYQGASSVIGFYTGPSSTYNEQMRIDSSGNVGIGTTNPTNKLEVSGSGAVLKVVGSGPTSGVSQLIVQADTTGGAPYSYNEVKVQNLDTTTQGAASRFVIMGPSYGTDIVQYNNATPDTGSMRAGVGAVRSSGSGLSLVASNPVSDMRFYTAGTSATNERMRITGAGNVGIGTTNPLGKLDVNGAIYQRGSQLHADYVFEPNYSLESIESHSKYMWQNKHLKAVPVATKDEKGQDIVNWGERNRGVLEELEKAHVYIQQLNERIKVLEASMKR